MRKGVKPGQIAKTVICAVLKSIISMNVYFLDYLLNDYL